MSRKYELEVALNRQIQEIIDLARVVTIFDGTDRGSIDDLRNSLFRLGELKLKYERYQNGKE
jgi:hypothetical protein